MLLKAEVIGLFEHKEVTVKVQDSVRHFKGDTIIVATGASERMVAFEGWTLPGVMGAGAAQTMMNIHGIQPGQRVLMLGSGNVGLVVSYQLLQAGCEVVAVVDASPRIGGYGVHASKITRCGVPFHLSHTIIRAEGTNEVERVWIGEVDDKWNVIAGTEKCFPVDTICLAVGLSPMSQILEAAGCAMEDLPGGKVPAIDEYGETSIAVVFVAGDVSGIEEASAAMIEGRIAGIAAAEHLGYIDYKEKSKAANTLEASLSALREGMFAPENRGKTLKKTEEGIEISSSLLKKGYLSSEEIFNFPGVIQGCAGLRPVIECSQNIPCNPCQDACRQNCISIGEKITSLPSVNLEGECTGCGMCVAACSGQAIFLVNQDPDQEYAEVTLPYEFHPLPQKGAIGKALNRKGEEICDAKVVNVRSVKAFDNTHLLTMEVPANLAMEARFFKG